MELRRLDPREASSLTRAAASGRTNRGPSTLCADGMWQGALDLIDKARSISIVTGFFIPAASAPETDGPPGAAILARALRAAAGKEVEILTDDLCLACVRAAASAAGLPRDIVRAVSGTDAPPRSGLLIYIERLGRAADGRYYDMRMTDISDRTAPLDQFALSAAVPVIAIGDGGNEVGMGRFAHELSKIMPDYARCLSSVGANLCLPVDVSNWGAYALAEAVAIAAAKPHAIARDDELAIIDAMIEAGAVDGVRKCASRSVDGLDAPMLAEVIAELTDI